MNSFLTVILISIALLAFCFAGLALTILVKKNGKFPETEIGQNKHMRRMGIRCTKQDEILRDRALKGRCAMPDDDCCTGCNGCGG